MVLAIDFDDTIHDAANAPRNRMGVPLPGAITSLGRFHGRGDTIIIFTAREVDKPAVYKAVADWLDYFGIPYDAITNVKQSYMDVFIDNRSLFFDTWPQTMARLSRMEVPAHTGPDH